MNLLHSLAAGVRGAANGTATVKLRGSATAAPVYADHARTVRRWGTLTLDSNGGTTAYVEDVADVKVYNLAGTLIRTFTDGEAATCVEVVSSSLTGEGYISGTIAASEPITLHAALAKVVTSFGAVDWKATGSLTLLSSFAGMSGMFFDVTVYGATGDGTTDDYLSIRNAVDAAALDGGVVWFPPGTYQVEYLIALPANVSLMGAGANASTIRQAGGVDLPVIVAEGGYGASNFISGLNITTTGSTGTLGDAFGLLNISNSARLVARDCHIGGTLCLGAAVWVDGGASFTEVRLERCQLTAGGTTQDDPGLGRCLHSAEAIGARITATECTFQSPTSCGNIDGIVLVYGLCIHLRTCFFDCTPLTAGRVYCFSPRVTDNGTDAVLAYNSLDGCTFSAGGGTDPLFALSVVVGRAADWFYEAGTIINSFTPFYHVRQGIDATVEATAFGTATYYCKRGSVGYYAEETEPVSDDVTPTLARTQTTALALNCAATTAAGDNRLRFDAAYAVLGQHVTVHGFGMLVAGSRFYGPGSFGEPADGQETTTESYRYSAPGLDTMIGTKFWAYRMTFMRASGKLTGRWMCTSLGADIQGPYNAAFAHRRRSY